MPSTSQALLTCLLTAALTPSIANAETTTESTTEPENRGWLSASFGVESFIQAGFSAHFRPSRESRFASYEFGLIARQQRLTSVSREGGPCFRCANALSRGRRLRSRSGCRRVMASLSVGRAGWTSL